MVSKLVRGFEGLSRCGVPGRHFARGLGVTVVQVGAGAAVGLHCLGSEEFAHGGPHPHPKFGIEVSQASRLVCLGVGEGPHIP